MVNHHRIGLTRINMKVNLTVTTLPHNSYELNAQSNQKIKPDSKKEIRNIG
jgi:hypothetical protein